MITKVVDVNDVQVGELVGVIDDTLALLIITVNGQGYRTFAGSFGFLESESREVYFNSGACSGQAYLAHPAPPPGEHILNLPPLNWALPGKTVYVRDTEEEPAIMNFSGKTYSQGGSCNVIGDDDDDRLVIPAIAAVDLDELYQTPFRLA